MAAVYQEYKTWTQEQETWTGNNKIFNQKPGKAFSLYQSINDHVDAWFNHENGYETDKSRNNRMQKSKC